LGSQNNKIKRTHHCALDEFDTQVSPDQKHRPGSLLLAEYANGLHDSTPVSAKDIEYRTFTITIPPQGHGFYLQVGDDSNYHIPFLDKIHALSPWLSEITPGSHQNMWIVSQHK
jgi:hypothetical protein